jgi:hypothetical protein
MNNIIIKAVYIESNTHNINKDCIIEKDEFTALFKDNKLSQGTVLSINGISYQIDKFKFEKSSFDNFHDGAISDPPFFYLKIFATKV